MKIKIFFAKKRTHFPTAVAWEKNVRSKMSEKRIEICTLRCFSKF